MRQLVVNTHPIGLQNPRSIAMALSIPANRLFSFPKQAESLISLAFR